MTPPLAAIIGATQDAGPNWVTIKGVSDAPVISADMSAAAVAVTDAPAAGHKHVITDVLISSDTTLRFAFTEETSTRVQFYMRCPAGSTIQFTPRSNHKLYTAAKKLMCQTSGAGNVEILVYSHVEV